MLEDSNISLTHNFRFAYHGFVIIAAMDKLQVCPIERIPIMMRFDRFTERAQEAAQRAAEIIQRYGHNQIDTEHMLLALIEQPEGVVPQILEILKVDPKILAERLDYILKTSPKANIFGGGGAGQIFITPRVKRI